MRDDHCSVSSLIECPICPTWNSGPSNKITISMDYITMSHRQSDAASLTIIRRVDNMSPDFDLCSVSMTRIGRHIVVAFFSENKNNNYI